MGSKAFKISVALIGGLVALSAMPGIGAMIGLFFAFAIAFFVAPLTFGLQWAINSAGVPIGFEQTVVCLLLLYYAFVLTGAYRAFRRFSMGNVGQARLIAAKAALFASLPLAGQLSMPVLARAWP